MPTPVDPPLAIHHFDRIEVRPAQRQLLIDGQPAALGARAFDLLLALIEHRDRVVSKNELLDLVWPGLVVEENNLQVQVSTLRKVLGPKAIATVPGRGYRFTLVGAASATGGEARLASQAPLQALGSMLGRDDDLAALLDLLDRHALVTVVGTGGVGKTTLARRAAEQRGKAWADGWAWVELASLTDERLVAGAVAQALELEFGAEGDASTLGDALKSLELMLVLDNAEHLIEAVASLATCLLATAPGVRMLVTSQSPLRVKGEYALRLEPLETPELGVVAAQAARFGAVALFSERARAADRHFKLTDENVALVVEICQRLDGLPLALELAAARVPLLGVRGVAHRLDDRFKLLAGGSRSAPTRQQTLQAALEWSLGLLSAAERRIFMQLGVFAGGFTLELASQVLHAQGAGDEWALIDALSVLAERSLLNVKGGDAPRYALSETARAFALSEPASATLQERHALALRRFFEAAPTDWLWMTDSQWLAHYEPEIDNLRAALNWAHLKGQHETLVALVGSAAPLWHHLSLYAESQRWHELSEPSVTASIPTPLAAQWWRAAQWAWTRSDPDRSRAAAEKAHELYREVGDVHGLYAELTGLAGMWTTPNERASAALAEALALERPDWPMRERAWGQRARADVARAEGRFADSRAAREAELALRTAAGDERGRLRALSHLASINSLIGDHAEAAQIGQVLVEALRGKRMPAFLAAALHGLAEAMNARGKTAEAAALMSEAEALGRPGGSARCPPSES